jgi:hypothetical protein
MAPDARHALTGKRAANPDRTRTEKILHANSAYELRPASSFLHDDLKNRLQGLPGVYRIKNGFGLANENNTAIVKDLAQVSPAKTAPGGNHRHSTAKVATNSKIVGFQDRIG